eukprot:CAMPEP_0114578200 /NCGR_PEP_ID=MMETSP0125-20121206/2767_1 /TAXON_ID=485358 ORGANISM="Aristerostoma sp., Strain ATCC 50986" /NCGR_SAMPLE_ID=MMETSP0125 /ASSEMBLY_ACC=CAM_ASM_000245 /LENGTH=143 /DNA_ID=CAMNT_0001768087 /DNA_START=955 /DNA_END=1383 /DNA_ORIENTATION=-
MAGRLLANRLFGGSKDNMDYVNIATTVFTPLELGTVGYTEAAAEEKFGKDNIIAYHNSFKPLEWNFDTSHPNDACYIKEIFRKDGHALRCIGIHYVGPNAGEVIQGFAVAVRIGVTKEQLDKTVGIHPTSAEELMELPFKSTE